LSRLKNDTQLARDMLLLLCQDLSRNASRAGNQVIKDSGQVIKKGRKPFLKRVPKGHPPV
jgi:hypothetical protein